MPSIKQGEQVMCRASLEPCNSFDGMVFLVAPFNLTELQLGIIKPRKQEIRIC